ncbi:MAG: hypothetical protein ACXU8U_12850, partial [Asticcacaulis sp.]
QERRLCEHLVQTAGIIRHNSTFETANDDTVSLSFRGWANDDTASLCFLAQAPRGSSHLLGRAVALATVIPWKISLRNGQ